MKLKKARNADGRAIPETYETPSGKYYIEKGGVGWNLYEHDKWGGLAYICTYDTLRDIRNDSNIT